VSIQSFPNIQYNAKSPDRPGAVDIAIGTTDVSIYRSPTYQRLAAIAGLDPAILPLLKMDAHA
jgi:hypothetical protein